MAKEIKRTFCRGMDDGGCGLLVTTESGRATRIAGDPECPLSKGFICPRGHSYLELLYHPDRLIHPMVRVGQKGEGKWRRVSWDEALQMMAGRFADVKGQYGGKSIFFSLGSPKGLEVFMTHRLASLLGTPNIITPGSVCHMPRELAHTYTCGSPSYPDLENVPRVLVLWGVNLNQTNVGGTAFRLWAKRAIDSGAKLVIIDPRRIDLTTKAEQWARIRPASDGALALGLLKVIVEEEIYDREFVSKWVAGWDELKAYLADVSLERVSRITWLTQDEIRSIGRMYSTNRPGVILVGNAVDHTPDSFQTVRAIALLKAITGNLDVPGGETLHNMPPLRQAGELALISVRGDLQKEMIGAEFKIACQNLFMPRHLVADAVLENKPYPLRAAWLIGDNPILTFADSARMMQALKSLDFLAVSDFFMTPSAALADLVLPAATFLEYDEIGHYASRYGMVVARPQVVDPVGECWPDTKVINELGKRLGFEKHFWPDLTAMLDYILAPAQINYDQLKKQGIFLAPRSYRKYLEKGFRTPSGKVEAFSRQLEEMGYPPMPEFVEPEASADYPYVLTCAKSPYYHHSGYRQLSSLRRLSPDPRMEINPETAATLGLKEGDWAYVENKKGRVRQRVRFNADLDPRVVFAEHGWWFPEKGAAELYGCLESNVNVLTDSHSRAEPAVGSTYLRGIPCRLSS